MRRGMMRAWTLLMCVVLLAAGTGTFAEDLTVEAESGEEWLVPESGELSLDADGLESGALSLDMDDLESGDLFAVPQPEGQAPQGNDADGEADGFTYELLADGTASITGCSLTGDVVIPDTVDGYTVTNLHRELFFDNSELTRVWVPATVTYFGDDPTDCTFTYVFSYCDNLTSINVASGNPSFRSVDGVLYSKDMRVLYNYPCSRAGEIYHVPEGTEILDCTSFACAFNLRHLYLDSPQTTWRTYTFFGDGDLYVHYLPGGYSESTVQYYMDKGLYTEADENFPTYVEGEVAVTGIAIAQGNKATLYMGNKLTLKATVTPAAAQTALKWSSGNKAVATVNAKGVVTPKKAGSAVITVKTDNGLSAKITVKVVDASSIKLKAVTRTLEEGTRVGLARGKSLRLKGVVSPAKVKTKLTWKSSSKFVTVKSGKVTVNKKAKVGTKARITVKTANGKSTYIYIVVKLK